MGSWRARKPIWSASSATSTAATARACGAGCSTVAPGRGRGWLHPGTHFLPRCVERNRESGGGDHRGDVESRLADAAGAVDIAGARAHPLGVVVEEAEPGIALVAEEPAHSVGFVIVIH